MLWHRHTWVEVARTICAGGKQPTRVENMSEHLYERLIFGLTVIELRCSGCGDVKSVELLGSQA